MVGSAARAATESSSNRWLIARMRLSRTRGCSFGRTPGETHARWLFRVIHHLVELLHLLEGIHLIWDPIG